MEQDFFSMLTTGETNAFHSAFVETILSAAPAGIQFLRIVRDSNNNITDFEFVAANTDHGENNAGKTFSILYPGNKQLFERLKVLAETGIAFQTGSTSSTTDKQPAYSYIKFGDGIFISGDGVGHHKKHKDGAHDGHVIKIGDHRQEAIRADKDTALLDRTLSERNHHLETLNAELKTINLVTSADYKETIQMLYTNLEYIITSDVRNMSDTSKANIRRAQAAIQRMKLLSDDINVFLQLYDIKVNKSIVDPGNILKATIAGMKEKLEQTNTRIEIGELTSLYADPALVSLLFIRILDNAIKFRTLDHSPLITVKSLQADQVTSIPMAKQNTPYTVISISDNGIGFDIENAAKVFELFYRLNDKIKYKGSGLGLAFCKKIMTMHDGFITAESTPDQGTTINCYFPSPQ